MWGWGVGGLSSGIPTTVARPPDGLDPDGGCMGGGGGVGALWHPGNSWNVALPSHNGAPTVPQPSLPSIATLLRCLTKRPSEKNEIDTFQFFFRRVAGALHVVG